jgi:O-antigen ligase
MGGKRQGVAYTYAPTPSAWVEYGCYFSLLYSMLAPGLGVEIPLLAGGLNLFLAANCVWQLRSQSKRIYAPIGLLLACALSFLLIQAVVHDQSLLGDLRGFILGFVQLVLIHSLCLRRGFSLRLPLLLFAIGAMALPFLTFNPGDIERARVDAGVVQGAISHPNGLADWFGFCAFYFTVIGIETRRSKLRVGAWLLAAGCLFVVGLTVSRGAIFAAALAITFALRGLLKRGFVPVFALIIVAGVLSLSGVFDAAVFHYSERGMEETGREALWSDAIERISESPIFGVGASKVLYTPHNTFLYFALVSGVVPLAFFIAFWIQAGLRSVAGNKEQQNQAFRFPYLLFTLVTATVGDLSFMTIWGCLALAVAAGSGAIFGKERLVVVRVGNKTRIGVVPAIRSSEQA